MTASETGLRRSRAWRRISVVVLAALLPLVLATSSVGAAPASQTSDEEQPFVPQPDQAMRASSTPIDEVIALTNAARARVGLPPLQPNENLMQSAQRYAAILAPGFCFGHTCPPTPFQRDRIAQAGYGDWQRIGENIAAGQRTAEAVVANWLASPGHRANILRPEYREIGVGVANGEGIYHIYWVQVFATPAQ